MEDYDDPIISIKVGDVMNDRPLMVDKTTNIITIADMMSKKDTETVLVMENSKVIGIVTEKDLLTKVLAKGKNPEETRAEDIMSSPVLTIDADENIVNAMIKIIQNKIRRLVVTRNDKVVGIITVSDLIRITPSIIDIMKEKLRANYGRREVSRFESWGYCDKCGSFSENLVLVEGIYLCDSCLED